ncbi:hypothetical protein HZF05_18540 [Sphingomonas sp. CGMCC 1.13654]|uniref:Uncharacterized protein n=1 Tax=Sphingomonas chungangi TaxID=2683589 RepID=A0A838LBK0_9SPHN|nr:hypothetical protein [Sphingomonas chungangi]MBA2936085.1 hypothetical protein [Sphingomonas chungangi]MVW55473.1 hypothetical protein [Sphingomonas chungangi]
MTTTAHWLHLRLGLPLVEVNVDEVAPVREPECAEADIVARQRAYAAAPLGVQFPAR